MYIAMRNHLFSFNFILKTIKEQNKEHIIVKDNVDHNTGKTFVHYIVNPLPFGSYENTKMLRLAIEFGFAS